MRLCEAFGYALITLGDVMARNEIPADDAWTAEYRAEHVAYLTKNSVPASVIDDMVHRTAGELFSFVQST